MILASGLLSSVYGSESKDDLAKNEYFKGMKALNEKSSDQAKLHFKKALEHSPNFIDARQKLHYVETNKSTINNQREAAKFKSHIIEKIDFKDEKFSDAVQIFFAIVEEKTKDSKVKLMTNYVINDPKKKILENKITLKLTNIPASIALDYMTNLAGAKYKFDTYSVQITPK